MFEVPAFLGSGQNFPIGPSTEIWEFFKIIDKIYLKYEILWRKFQKI